MMLASRGAVSDITSWVDRGWLFDLKIDGVRCVATVDSGVVRLVSRGGADITGDYPEVVAALVAQWPKSGHVTLDGEIAVVNDSGYPDWSRTLKRAAQQRRASYWALVMPARFYAFDVLRYAGLDMRMSKGYADRRTLLVKILRGAQQALTITPMTSDGHTLWSFVVEHNLEGVIAKRPDSRYRTGRSSDWVKIKRTRSVTCLVGGYDEGEGSRAATFGALHLYLLDPAGRLVPVGRVGSGFSNFELRQVKAALSQPPLIVEVEYLDASPTLQLRQPVFTRLRHDADPSECTLDQLTDSTGGPND